MLSRWEKIDELTGKVYVHWPSYDIWDKDYNVQLNQEHLQHKSLDKFIPGRLLWRGQIQGPNTWDHLKKYYERDEQNNLFLWRHLWKSQDSMVSRFGKKIWSMSADSRKKWKPEFYKAEDLNSLAKLDEEKKEKEEKQAIALLKEYRDCRHWNPDTAHGLARPFRNEPACVFSATRACFGTRQRVGSPCCSACCSAARVAWSSALSVAVCLPSDYWSIARQQTASRGPLSRPRVSVEAPATWEQRVHHFHCGFGTRIGCHRETTVVITGPFIKNLLHNHSVIYKIIIFFFRRSKRQRKF